MDELCFCRRDLLLSQNAYGQCDCNDCERETCSCFCQGPTNSKKIFFRCCGAPHCHSWTVAEQSSPSTMPQPPTFCISSIKNVNHSFACFGLNLSNDSRACRQHIAPADADARCITNGCSVCILTECPVPQAPLDNVVVELLDDIAQRFVPYWMEPKAQPHCLLACMLWEAC
mmetsp:Transcript_116500/g.226596  ORF Transcript_116500/g.226596 Transcript_116500/m.226596 type:complete len:172 (-) Transcript_116500:1295-1810(-)